MVNDLKHLLRANVVDPPPEHVDVELLVAAGRRRVLGRRTALAGGTAVLAAGVVVATLVAAGIGDGNGVDPARPRPTPDAPTIRLSDATRAVEGQDYRVLTSYTNKDLDADNGQYLDGTTEDGLVLFRDGPRSDQLRPRFALMDPATGDKDWLPELRIGQSQTWPVELSADRLVLLGYAGEQTADLDGELAAYVFDRGTRKWTTMTWPDLPAMDFPGGVAIGPDGRLYVSTPATQGRIPEGGWPVGEDGEAEDADAEGDTYDLWSVSLTDPADARDEQLVVGDVAFTDDAMVWTDSSGGAAGKVHVRDLASGQETSFDPHLGERCNLLGFGATGDRIMMSQYCGTYAGGVRDDRVQIVSTDGEQVITLQDSGVEGWLPAGNDVVNVSVFGGEGDDSAGAYVYDLDTDRFLRVSDAVSNFGIGGPPSDPREFTWHTPVNNRHGATQWIGELLR